MGPSADVGAEVSPVGEGLDWTRLCVAGGLGGGGGANFAELEEK